MFPNVQCRRKSDDKLTINNAVSSQKRRQIQNSELRMQNWYVFFTKGVPISRWFTSPEERVASHAMPNQNSELRMMNWYDLFTKGVPIRFPNVNGLGDLSTTVEMTHWTLRCSE